MTPMVARCLGSESIFLFLRDDERPFEVEGGDARRDEIVEGNYFPRGKGGRKGHVFVPSSQAGQERVHTISP